MTRRKFFGMLGAVAAAISLPIPPVVKRLAVMGGNLITSTGSGWATLDERIFFQVLRTRDADLLPSVPSAADGEALFASTPRSKP